MSNGSAQALSNPRSDESHRLVRSVGIGSAAGATALAAFAIWGDGSPDTSQAANALEFLVVVLLVTVVSSALFGWGVPRLLRRESAGGTALALGIGALLSVPFAFWAGIPVILASAGLLLATSATRRSALNQVAAAVAAVALIAEVAIIVADWMSTNSVI